MDVQPEIVVISRVIFNVHINHISLKTILVYKEHT